MPDSPFAFAAIATGLVLLAFGYLAGACFVCSLIQTAYGTTWSLIAFAGLMAAEVFTLFYAQAKI